VKKKEGGMGKGNRKGERRRGIKEGMKEEGEG
jgi:hypothetical protein